MPHRLSIGEAIDLDTAQSHYLMNVMRLKPGDPVRIFNETDGEFLGITQSQKAKTCTLSITECLRAPTPEAGPAIAFGLIKKPRQEFVIEKCTELGVQQFFPLVMDHCEVRSMNEKKTQQHIIAAAEQSERLTLPTLHSLQIFKDFIANTPGKIWVCLERQEATPLNQAIQKMTSQDVFMIGPEGGFSDREKEIMANLLQTHYINLGPNILRAETAAITCVATWLHKN